MLRTLNGLRVSHHKPGHATGSGDRAVTSLSPGLGHAATVQRTATLAGALARGRAPGRVARRRAALDGLRPIALAAAVSCALALAACGSSGPSSAAGTGNGDAAALRFADCMRAHGVPGFPDPGTPVGGRGSGINPQAPAFRSAERACGEPAGGFTPPPVSESRKLEAIAWAKCLRAHGVPGFPDPTLSPPSGGGLDFAGLYFALGPGDSPQSPAFKQGARACGMHP
jgi:hypothetical protein